MARLPLGNDGHPRCNCHHHKQLPLCLLQAAVSGVEPKNTECCVSPPLAYE